MPPPLLTPMENFLEHFTALLQCSGGGGLLHRHEEEEGQEARQGDLELRAALSLVHNQRLFYPICSEPTQRPRTVCERWRENLLEHYGGVPRDDQYVPQCDDLGHFTPLQCHGKSDFCWCVDKDGREVQGTRSQPGTTPACKYPGTAPTHPGCI